MADSLRFKITSVVRKGRLHELDQDKDDLQYWLSRPVQERAAAVTFLVFESLPKGERMDKTIISKKRLKLK